METPMKKIYISLLVCALAATSTYEMNAMKRNHKDEQPTENKKPRLSAEEQLALVRKRHEERFAQHSAKQEAEDSVKQADAEKAAAEIKAQHAELTDALRNKCEIIENMIGTTFPIQKNIAEVNSLDSAATYLWIIHELLQEVEQNDLFQDLKEEQLPALAFIGENADLPIRFNKGQKALKEILLALVNTINDNKSLQIHNVSDKEERKHFDRIHEMLNNILKLAGLGTIDETKIEMNTENDDLLAQEEREQFLLQEQLLEQKSADLARLIQQEDASRAQENDGDYALALKLSLQENDLGNNNNNLGNFDEDEDLAQAIRLSMQDR